MAVFNALMTWLLCRASVPKDLNKFVQKSVLNVAHDQIRGKFLFPIGKHGLRWDFGSFLIAGLQ